MKQVVSKVRTKKTKTREKQAGKALSGKAPLQENPVIGLGIAFLLWISVMVVLDAEHILQRQTSPRFLLPLAGDGVFLLVSLLAVGLILKIVRPAGLRRNSMILLVSLISLISIISAKALLYAVETTDLIPREIAGFLLPFAMAPLLATILADSTIGVATGIWTSLVMAILVGKSFPLSAERIFPLFITGMVVTVVAAQTARNVRTRSKVFRIGLAAGLSKIACVFGVTALKWQSSDVMLVLNQAGACLLGGFFSAIVVLLILPLFETLFRITTDITLLEISDLGHPLLQRLAIEAPGTYHHSLVVASLAQAGADEIGANSLLARVCAYFHDVGKLTKPRFFAENIQLQSNPHDDLLPSMSTLVITAHVKEGLSLAMLHKLPDPVMNVIREHHGTSLLSYFHRKATDQLEFELSKQDGTQTNEPAKVDESDFRYTGPKPSSRESAIICLADAVEAASRSMDKTTPGHIESMINEIINTRLEDEQLDQCDLTLADLTRIKQSFVFTLTNMLHGRVPYPKDENRDKQQTKTAQAKQAKNKEADTASDGSGPQARP